jgi:hypothetical protein
MTSVEDTHLKTLMSLQKPSVASIAGDEVE